MGPLFQRLLVVMAGVTLALSVTLAPLSPTEREREFTFAKNRNR